MCVCVCVWQPTPRRADVTVTTIAGYVRVRILVERWFFSYFGSHTFYATATLLNIWICMQWTCGSLMQAAGDCGADWTLHPRCHNNVGGVTAGQARRNSSNVGVLLRAKWDTTLVITICTLMLTVRRYNIPTVGMSTQNSVASSGT